ncbi:MAG TPA: hypothetical protein VGK49_00830 [Ilumatobacteraceae bacterium]
MSAASADGSPPVNGNGEAARIAREAGLLYLPDDRPGIRRRRRGGGFSYVEPSGRKVAAAERDRIAALAIPPAWTDVWIAPEADAHLVATGVDARGRKQYLYHPAWRAAADVAKFDRLASFGPGLVRLRRAVADDLRSLEPGWVCAALVRLIDDALIRPGDRRYFRTNGSVGATTLSPEHLSVSRQVVRLQFEGKGAVEHDIQIRDPLLARRISDLLDQAQPGQPIFADESDVPVDRARLNAYISAHAGAQFSAKDLRTWGATCLVARELVAVRDRDADECVRDAIAVAAEQLGNTPAVCRSSYVAPAVVDSFESGSLVDAWRRSRRTAWLSRVEQTVSRVLTGGA